jgi:hypothetical protein
MGDTILVVRELPIRLMKEIVMKFPVLPIVVLPVLVLISVTACSDKARRNTGSSRQDAWLGTYTYSGSAGETAGGTPVSIAYRLVLAEKTSGEATLIIRGYQTDEALSCEIVETDDRIEVKFRSYASGKTTNEFGVQQYQPGSVLFTLERVGEGKQQKLRTNWKSLRPDTAKSESGEYFTKGSGT